MTLTREQIEQMPAGPEMDTLIEIEIYKSIPLTDDEIDIFKVSAAMSHGQTFREKIRLFKIPLSEPDYQTGLMFRLSWPRSHSHEGFGEASRLLVNKMRQDGWLFSLFDVIERDRSLTKAAEFMKLTEFGEEFPTGKAKAETDTLAICCAALIAKLEEEALNKRGVK